MPQPANAKQEASGPNGQCSMNRKKLLTTGH
jgi:hypothetical protein